MVSPKNRLLSLTLAFALLFSAACATVPLTNRQQLRLIPDVEILSISFQQYDQIKKESKLSEDKTSISILMRVGERISKVADEFINEMHLNMVMDWEFILIEDDKTVNAWCMPGGKVAVYTGILPYTKDETGLATVIGHEVAHALAQHGNERMSQGLLVELGGITLSRAMESKPKTTQTLWLQAFGLGASLGFILPYSRTHEYEADRIGLVLMARAGYNPQEAVGFWERMSQSGGKKPPEFLSTHPADKNRIAALKNHLPEAMRYYQSGRTQ
ncbi:MAG: M48 family metallopeptidase [bacterium]